MKKEKIYKKLPGSGRDLAGRTSLYMAKDHLLSVKQIFWEESYKKYYFNTIQALIIRETKKYQSLNILFGLFLFLFGLLTILVTDIGVKVIWGVFGGVALLFLCINLFKGKSCKCHIRTPVSEDILLSVRRLRAARKLISQLRPAVENVQGAIDPSSFPQMPQLNPDTHIGKSKTIDENPYTGKFHHLFHISLITTGILELLTIEINSLILICLLVTSALAAMAFLILALINQTRSKIPGGVQKNCWIAIVLMGAYLLYYYGLTIYFSIKRAGQMVQQWDLIKDIAYFSEIEILPVLIIKIILGCSILFSGIIGWFLFRYRIAPAPQPERL